MKNVYFCILFTLTIAANQSCNPTEVALNRPYEKLEVGPGPEDMVLDTLNGDPRLIISCAARREVHLPYGEMEALDLETGKRQILTRYGEPGGTHFSPHGIYLDSNMLYVINHQKEPDLHPIFKYRLHGDSLQFQEKIETPLQHSPNALVTGPLGEIYVVNDSGKRGSMAEKIFRLKRASVVRLSKDSTGTWEPALLAEGLGYPAGINRIGDHLYVGDAILHVIHVYHISRNGLSPVTQFRNLKGNDNIRIHQGALIVPGHTKPFRFIGHTKDPEKTSPVTVYKVDAENGEAVTLYSTDGTSISAGSAALIYGGYLYICQVFDPYVLKVEL
jgi:hypothetical protein